MIEVKAGTQGYVLVYRPDEWRPAIFKVYNRKVAELAQLFPIIHSFETALRSTVAVMLEQHYQHQRWWRAIYEELRRGGNAKSIRTIGRSSVSKRAAFRIGKILCEIDGADLSRGTIDGMTNGYEFLQSCDLAHTRQLIEEHWSIFASRFRPLTAADFSAKFERVRHARNAVYHHKSLSGMSDVVSAAEEILDCMNFSLRFVYEKVCSCEPTPPHFAFQIEARHRTWAP